ncbi:MAG: DUF1446 domain-containing protein [Gammaproteobacteria bacterium]|nr:DUF1446 domain-containing protein [Gammaproteobacteria bacterium]
MGGDKIVRIGCASGFWGDTSVAARQLVQSGQIDYLVFDYLAEVTMSILAGQMMKDPEAGYAKDFIRVLQPLLPAIKEQGIKVVANAGGLNPAACRQAMLAAAEAAGVDINVGIVEGDNLARRAAELQSLPAWDQYGGEGESFPSRPVSINAYLGATPVKAALDGGADIVITGRCVDSAVVLGPLMHEFGWGEQDYDLLSAGSLAGHILECGAQCTGGNFTDWQDVPDYAHMGFPIAECAADGSFVVTKPDNTGGLVSKATVAEQMVYEIGDPRQYMLPDVVCDWTQVAIKQIGENRVEVSNAKGLAPTAEYKVSATYMDGFRATGMLMVGGIDAAKKAHTVANAIIERCNEIFAAMKLGSFSEVNIEALGAEDTYGEHARTGGTREVFLKMGVKHPDKKALVIFSGEIAPAATGMTPGITGYFGGRPKVSPVIRLFSTRIAKADVPVTVDLGEGKQDIAINADGGFDAAQVAEQADVANPQGEGLVEVPLVKLAWGRSGDKGDHANIGIIARQPEYLPWIRAALSTDAVKQYFSHICEGDVLRWELPGIDGLNFLLKNTLGGGGIASLRADPQGKCFAQMLLDHPVAIPAELL